MKNKRLIYLLGAIVIIITGACEKLLDREVVLEVRDDQANTLYDYAQNKAYALYKSLPSGFQYIDGAMMASASDEAEHTLETSAVQKFNTGAWNSVDNPDNAWNGYFEGIRNANIFLETAGEINLDRYRLDPNPARQLEYQTRVANIKRWKYEARFMRAFFYFELVKRYGGVPIMTRSLTLDEDYKSIDRNTFAECIKFHSSTSVIRRRYSCRLIIRLLTWVMPRRVLHWRSRAGYCYMRRATFTTHLHGQEVTPTLI